MFIVSDKFKEYMIFRKWSNANLAKELGYTEAYVSYILSGKRPINTAFMERIMTTTKLPFDLCFTLVEGKERPNHWWQRRADLRREKAA